MKFDSRYSESDWLADSDARERAYVRFDSIQLQDVQTIAPPRCCLDSANFTAVPALERDSDTGYLDGTFYQCQTCGSRIAESDYAALVEYENQQVANRKAANRLRREAA